MCSTRTRARARTHARARGVLVLVRPPKSHRTELPFARLRPQRSYDLFCQIPVENRHTDAYIWFSKVLSAKNVADVAALVAHVATLAACVTTLVACVAALVAAVSDLAAHVGALVAQVGALVTRVGALVTPVGALVTQVGALVAQVEALVAHSGPKSQDRISPEKRSKEHYHLKGPPQYMNTSAASPRQ